MTAERPVPGIERVDAPTEARNARTVDIDVRPTLEILEALNAEDATVPEAVRRALPALARAVDAASERVRDGGRIHYFGAGTSGRLAVLDAAEIPTTFALDGDVVRAHHAGGATALEVAREGAEDDVAAGARDAEAVRAGDLAMGLTASGRTPYVGGALEAARARRAATVLVSCNPAAPLAPLADVHVSVDTGPEAIAGSTRLKAGTAQKLVLNAFSTAVMIRLGRTYSNLMVGMVASNAKLRGRVLTLLMQASGAPEATAHEALRAADGDTRTALVILLAGTGAEEARAALAAHDGRVRDALASLGGLRPSASGS
jgi:N-acetylmuramic acid 6-phosphate etherase